jgi:hypothetical protein
VGNYDASDKRQPTPGPRLRKTTDLGHQTGKDFTGPGNQKAHATWDGGHNYNEPSHGSVTFQRARGGKEWTDLASLTTEYKGKEKASNTDLHKIE